MGVQTGLKKGRTMETETFKGKKIIVRIMSVIMSAIASSMPKHKCACFWECDIT
jgi:hypothetical protein